MYRTFPAAEFATFALCARLLPQARAASNLITRFRFRFSEAALLLNQTAIYLQRRGQYQQAEPLFDHALQIWRTSLLGEKTQNFATGLNNLAVLYLAQGKYTVARVDVSTGLEDKEGYSWARMTRPMPEPLAA